MLYRLVAVVACSNVSLHAVHVLEAPTLCGFREFSFSLVLQYYL
jgi:hypothetical protein